jgi:predicted RNA binding protein YcfA (HicA-like mRNA interferase family)
LVKLQSIPWKKLVDHLREFGFEGPFQGGKHPYMIRGDTVITIPNPHKREISIDLLQRILRMAGITREEWLGEK